MSDLIMKARTFLQLQRGFLFRYGWLRSWWKERPIDRDGNPLPWLTYPAIDFISQFDFSQARVFEWGAGSSTLWWVKRCQKITSVESDEKWADKIQPLLLSSAEFIRTLRQVDAELAALDNHPSELFDVIVIDNHGPFRWRCAELATHRLADGGMIILDNSDQCLKAAKLLRDEGFTEIDFSGFAPSNNYAHTTSIFFRSWLKFRTYDDQQPRRSVAQPNPPWPKC
jgi:hypothetical protein